MSITIADMTRRKAEETEQISVRLNAAMLERLERIGDAQPAHVTLTYLINWAVREFVENHESTPSPKRPKPK